MSNYLNKIGLLKYNNNTYKQIGNTEYYTIRDPNLVSSDSNTDYFNFPWKSDLHWTYNNYGLGWFFNGKNLIAFTTNVLSTNISSYNPVSNSYEPTQFLYNVIPIPLVLLTSISNYLTNGSFTYPKPMYLLSTTNDEIIEVKYSNDYRACGNLNNPSTYTYYTISGDETINFVLNWSPLQNSEDVTMHPNEPPFVTGYWTNSLNPICGVMYSYPFYNEGNITDLYSNNLIFELQSPNISGIEDTNSLCSNLVEGVFTSIPGTDYITGICTTKMHFIDDLYVYMRGLFKGNLNINDITNDVQPPSTVIRKVGIKNLQGTLKNITELPDKIKYNLNHYYAWGWLYGVDNITYKNVWYKNEISGVLTSSTGKNRTDEEIITDKYNGNLSTTIITNNGEDDIVNVITGIFMKEENSNIITGYMEGVIEPYSIQMKGYLTGYYSLINNNTLKPLQLSGILYNKSVIGSDLRLILDIKYANTLGRKGLSYPSALNGLNLNYASKNYNPYDKPYMLLSWKIIEYKTSNKERDYINEIPNEKYIDLNTYIVDKKVLQHYNVAKLTKKKLLLPQSVTEISDDTKVFSVYWDSVPSGDYKGLFSLVCVSGNVEDKNAIKFNSSLEAQTYVQHICRASNLKLKNYIAESTKISYILESSDLEIL